MRWRRVARCCAAIMSCAAVATLAGCSFGQEAPADTRAAAPTGAQHAGPQPVRSTLDTPALAAIRSAIDQINAAAGGPVARQRAVLNRLAAPDQSGDQRHCPDATTTLAFDPAYRDVRAPRDAGGPYLLPTYIWIYTGARITGSDLATLRWWIVDGAARSEALCVS